ncbi:MAG: GNAT family N-acetyltransferase [Sulfobacillus benefaciens]|uniref:GNAT family N-acetyltransferase n=1 Tax=Sulfobacillus benefaciens TaxID=453960 RepID=A0A2T2X5E6_9FIRM|nr:MAG: GNAT family N-acetyltransferase [Sulfobacillus benefaciens]
MKEAHIRYLNHSEQWPLSLLQLADPSQAVIESYMARAECFVAEQDSEPVGVYVLLETRPQTVELVNVAVKEDKQGQGLGKQLVLHAIETARTRGYKAIQVGTGNSSIGQLALYQKCGFSICGIDRDFFVVHYAEPIYENGIQCRDMIRLSMNL